MPTCKFTVVVGNTGRYSKRCDAPAMEAVVFKTVLDHGYVIQTQLPVCSDHLYEKVDMLEALQIDHYTVKL